MHSVTEERQGLVAVRKKKSSEMACGLKCASKNDRVGEFITDDVLDRVHSCIVGKSRHGCNVVFKVGVEVILVFCMGVVASEGFRGILIVVLPQHPQMHQLDMIQSASTYTRQTF